MSYHVSVADNSKSNVGAVRNGGSPSRINNDGGMS